MTKASNSAFTSGTAPQARACTSTSPGSSPTQELPPGAQGAAEQAWLGAHLHYGPPDPDPEDEGELLESANL